MDRDLTPGQRRQPLIRTASFAALAVTAFAVILWGGERALRPALNLDDVRTATVERGPLLATVTSTGTIVPRTAQTVSSPVAAGIRRVHVSPGEPVAEGQLLMELDTTASALALNNQEEQLELLRAEIRSVSLQHDDTIRQARSREELLAIDLQSREVTLDRLQQLGETGGVSQNELLEAELNVRRTEVELRQIAAQIVSLEQRREADLTRLELEYSILDKQRAEQARRVEMSNVRATRDGIVIFLEQDEGSVVAEGQALATVAADDSFRVEASVADFYGPQLRPNQRVLIESSTETFGGRLSRILSVADSARLDLYIELDDPAAPAFHTNLSVDIRIVTAERPDVLKVRRGPALEDGGTLDLFRIEGNAAVSRRVRLGVAERQEVEVIDGLSEGDTIVISDTSAFDGMSEIRIR